MTKQELLDKLIDDAPDENEGAVMLQLQLDGQPYAGSVRRSEEHVGLYQMVAVDPQSRAVANVFFDASDIGPIFVPVEAPSEASRIVTPRGH